MDITTFRDLANQLFNGKFGKFTRWVEDQLPGDSLVLDPLTDEEVTPTFGSVYLAVRLDGRLADFETKLASDIAKREIVAEAASASTPEHFQSGEWEIDQVLYGNMENLVAAIERRFDGNLQSFLNALVGISVGSTFEYLNKPEANTGGFRGAIEAFQQAGQLDSLFRLLLGWR